MRFTYFMRVGTVALLAVTLAACASQDERTQPTAPAGYVSPAQIGPAVPEDAAGAEQNGAKGGETAATAAAK